MYQNEKGYGEREEGRGGREEEKEGRKGEEKGAEKVGTEGKSWSSLFISIPVGEVRGLL